MRTQRFNMTDPLALRHGKTSGAPPGDRRRASRCKDMERKEMFECVRRDETECCPHCCATGWYGRASAHNKTHAEKHRRKEETQRHRETQNVIMSRKCPDKMLGMTMKLCDGGAEGAAPESIWVLGPGGGRRPSGRSAHKGEDADMHKCGRDLSPSTLRKSAH